MAGVTLAARTDDLGDSDTYFERACRLIATHGELFTAEVLMPPSGGVHIAPDPRPSLQRSRSRQLRLPIATTMTRR
jgi:hypothetical protein